MTSFVLILAIIGVWVFLGIIPVVLCIRSSQFTKEVKEYEAYLKKHSSPFPRFEGKRSFSQSSEISQKTQ